MEFQQVLEKWRSNGNGPAADHVSEALDTLGKRHPQVLANLEGDRHITLSRCEELLEQLLRVSPGDPEVVAAKVESFCWAHQGKGPRQQTAQRADLGHVEARARFEAQLKSVSRWFSMSRRRGFSAALSIDRILVLDLRGQHDWLKGVWLAQRQMWSFYQSRATDDPFRDLPKQNRELVRRLGLGHALAPVELLLWSHRLRADQTATVPTTFDAALYQFYRPGGKTRPLAGDDGLREVVHPPITGDQLTRRIESAIY